MCSLQMNRYLSDSDLPHRVDHLYTFFVEWSPDIYTEQRRKHGFLLVKKEKHAVIDSLLRDPDHEHWNVRISFLLAFYK